MESDHHGELDGIFGDLQEAAEQAEALTAAQILDVIGARGFGPVLVVLSFFLILPVGMVPGMPAVVGLLMFLIGLMLVLGRKRLHLPRKVGALSLASHRIIALTTRVRPLAARLRGVLHPRLSFLAASRPALVAIGLLLMGTGAIIFAVGFIPFLPFFMALHVLLIGLGLTTRDGVAILAAAALAVPEVLLLLRLV